MTSVGRAVDRPSRLRENLATILCIRVGAEVRAFIDKAAAVVVDDNADDALLIRRLLEGRKAYRVYHAKDGWDGLALARQKLPDLIVSDLTMPGIDGFGFVEELKLDPRTKDIPVVVVSAKDITVEERKRLNGHIEALYQKGSLPARKFVDQVIHVIEDKIEDKSYSP